MHREKTIYRVTIVGMIVNAALVGLKLVAGLLGNSSAIIADAIHSLSDFITDLLVLVLVRFSAKPPDATHHYGHAKFETLASFVIGFILLLVAGGIIFSASTKIMRWADGENILVPNPFVLWIAAISIVAKEILYRYTAFYGGKMHSDVLTSNAWHHRSDALSSIGAFIGIGGSIVGGKQWTILDPLTSIIIGGVLIKVAIELLKKNIKGLTDGSLSRDVEEQVRAIILSTPGVSQPHHLFTRQIGSDISIEVHVRMDGKMTLENAHTLVSEIEKKIKEQFGNHTHIIVHAEPIHSSRYIPPINSQ